MFVPQRDRDATITMTTNRKNNDELSKMNVFKNIKVFPMTISDEKADLNRKARKRE